MSQRVVLIGGASRSGKTVLGKKLAAALRCERFELDAVYQAILDGIASWRGADQPEARGMMEASAPAVVEALIATGRSLVIEGGWISPEAAAGLRDRLVHARIDIVYLGYPHAELADKIAEIGRDRSRSNWLARLPKADVAEFTAEQIRGSRYYQEECERHGVAFLDTSSGYPDELAPILATRS